MDDLIQEFLTETKESLEALDTDIVKLEQNPNNKDLISRIFRLVHTVKGTCGFLGLPRLEKVAHHSENIMGRFRDGGLEVSEDTVSVILESFDRIKDIVESIAQTGTEAEGDDSVLIAKLDAIYESTGKPNKTMANEEVFVPVKAEETKAAVIETKQFTAEKQEEHEVEVEVEVDHEHDHDEEHEVEEVIVKAAAATVDKKQRKANSGEQTLRVSVDVLENLMTTVSELVLSRNQIMQILRAQEDSPFAAPLHRLNHVVSELQEGVMQTRMQPIGNAWNKLPRIIRDLSVELGKNINLEMKGQETELDRQVLELIKDPLTHMVRNSADHGVETPAERKAVGKPEFGTVLLNAFHEGGHIIIEISDDGKGLNVDAIRKKALSTDVITKEEAKDMTEQQIQQLIFAPGFSTAAKVTSVSGRGVGMDVVRTNVEKIGGTIEMKSVWGKGSTFTIKIPLTLAIVSALIVEVGGERYAIPQISVKELVRISKEANDENQLEGIHGAPVMRLRDRLLPLVSLRKLLQIDEHADENKKSKIAASYHNGKRVENSQVVVAQVGSSIFGIIVDKVFDTEEIVVKPVSPILKGIKLFSGNTILGDGSVIMILDPNGVANAMGSRNADAREMEDQLQENLEKNLNDAARKTSLLIFKAGKGAKRAVPLSLVSRLEDFDVKNIEVSDDKKVIQYRGKLMPLIPFSSVMVMKEKGTQPVLVFSERDKTLGLMVDEIVDIVEEYVDVQISSESHKGLLGSAIIEGEAMDVIDVGYFISQAYSNEWYGKTQSYTSSGVDTGRTVLLVDDSPFFLNMLTPILGAAGYNVISANSAKKALEMHKQGKKINLIVSDIEMPDMNGYELAKAIKDDDCTWKDIPIIALSSHATPQDLQEGRDAGFTDYVAKFDREALLRAISQIGDR